MFVCPFPTDPKFWKTGVAFFFLFFFLVFNFAFLNKIVKLKVSKYIVTVPEVYCVGTEGICLPNTCLHQIVWCHWFKCTKLYMHFSNIQIKKKKTYRPSQFSGQKGKQTFFFRPNPFTWKSWKQMKKGLFLFACFFLETTWNIML